MDDPSSGSQPAPVDNAASKEVKADPERWVDEHGDYLYRFALARVRDATVAADLVQEAFLGALKGRSFAGRSSERSWLAGILKNKIVDHFRRAGREVPFTDLEFYEGGEAGSFLQQGWSKGKWLPEAAPSSWSPEPGAALDQEAFWRAFWDCVQGLPPRVASVFLQRELDDVSSEEICDLLDIRPNNLWVMLHRARMALRLCLESSWFKREL